jgi:actin-related protein 5
MIGNIEAGIAETVEYILKQFDPTEQFELANNVFVTGGCGNFPGNVCRLIRYRLFLYYVKMLFQV